MLTRGHIVIILSSAIITIGVLLTIISGIDTTRPFLTQDISVANHIINAGESQVSSVNITETGPIMSIVIKADPPHVPISTIVKDQNDTILGYLSLFDKNENPKLSALGDMFTGVSLIILGNLGFIAGVMVIIRDKSIGYKGNMCTIWKLVASKTTRYFEQTINRNNKT